MLLDPQGEVAMEEMPVESAFVQDGRRRRRRRRRGFWNWVEGAANENTQINGHNAR